jgi:hypothetical protein
LENISKILENQKETIDILHQSALENEQLTELLSPQIVQ